MILLGVNCGHGQTNCAVLPQSAVDFDGGWVEFPRPKTGVERRCPLWTETVTALRESGQKRAEPANEELSSLMFLTRFGSALVRHSVREDGSLVRIDRIGEQFDNKLRLLNLKRPGVNSYALRHTFETIVGGRRDQVAIDSIMGHVEPTMTGLYRERISDDRLQSVVDYVHNWLWPTE